MIPLLLIVGAGAALELKRLLQRPPSDVVQLQKNEQKIKKLVESLRSELVQQQRAHAEDQKLVQDLRLEHDRLKSLTESLSSSLERLQVENGSLTQQLMGHDSSQGENHIGLHDLKLQVANILEQFLRGTIKVEGLLQNLDSIGVKIDCGSEELEELRTSGNTSETVGDTDEEWKQKVRFLMDDPERVALRLASVAHRDLVSSARIHSIAFPKARTPPKSQKDVRLPCLAANTVARSERDLQALDEIEGVCLVQRSQQVNSTEKRIGFLPKVILKKPQFPRIELDITSEWGLTPETSAFFDSPSAETALTVSKKAFS
eukprot:jgi/Botrbrau1/5282/Bobra.0391s0003.1